MMVHGATPQIHAFAGSAAMCHRSRRQVAQSASRTTRPQSREDRLCASECVLSPMLFLAEASARPRMIAVAIATDAVLYCRPAVVQRAWRLHAERGA